MLGKVKGRASDLDSGTGRNREIFLNADVNILDTCGLG